MSEEFLAVNGLNGSTGGYLLPELTALDVARVAKGEGVRFDKKDRHIRELKDRKENEDHFGPIEGVDDEDLGSAGWGVIFNAADSEAPAIREALAELLDHRREQAGQYYKEIIGPDSYRPPESKREFFKRHKVGPGPANPAKMPYYLLIVGSPEAIPFMFQYQLDVQYAVGRIHFETLDEYAAYARSVVAAEKGELRRARQAAFFGVANPGDASTERSTRDLIRPLAEKMAAAKLGLDVRTIVGDEATKARLAGLISGDSDPAFLFTASHGMGFDLGDPKQIPHGGALVCQDWPGVEGRRVHPVTQDHYFSADDVSSDLRPGGLVSFHFACYGAGTPMHDEFAAQDFEEERGQIAPLPFLARLPQRLLAHPRGGALAVVGHVERAWTWSFSWPGAGPQLDVFESTLKRLFRGVPVGAAIEYFNQRYAELSTDLSVALEDVKFNKDVDEFDLADMWTSNNDARSYAILGDPAIRLAIGDPETGGDERLVTEVRTSPPEEPLEAAGPGEDEAGEDEAPGSFDPFSVPMSAGATEEEPEYHPVEVFYGTDRRCAFDGDTWDRAQGPKEAYGGQRNEGGELELGTCTVSIPFSHEEGELESPGLFETEDPAEHVLLLSIHRRTREVFVEQLKTRIGRSAEKAALVFVHGYNVSFEDAARRTAQMAFDLDFDGAPVMYSWPSRAGLEDYMVDEANNRWTVPHLQEFLRLVAHETDAEKIHLIAHSMGNRAVTEVLRRFAVETPSDAAPRFNQIALVAPDVDADVFRDEIAPAVRGVGRVTLYASSGDKALKASKKVHGHPRAGDLSSGVVLADGVATVDASDVDTSLLRAISLGHSYFAEKPSVISDLRQLLAGAEPAQRGGLARTGNGKYWKVIPEA